MNRIIPGFEILIILSILVSFQTPILLRGQFLSVNSPAFAVCEGFADPLSRQAWRQESVQQREKCPVFSGSTLLPVMHRHG